MLEVCCKLEELVTVLFQCVYQPGGWLIEYRCRDICKHMGIIGLVTPSVRSSKKHDTRGVIANTVILLFQACLE